MSNLSMDILIKGKLDDVKPKVVKALNIQGFGILTEIDVQKTLKEKIGVDCVSPASLGHIFII